MNVFISWSGDQSRHIAEALRDWLKPLIQTVTPWVSSQDIEKGTRSLEEINAELKEANFGIICLTPENLGAKWIHFEAGALSKALTSGAQSRVWTYLWNLKHSDIQGPLSQFQHTLTERADTKKLIAGINKFLKNQLRRKPWIRHSMLYGLNLKKH